jgi:hypothetical protein
VGLAGSLVLFLIGGLRKSALEGVEVEGIELDGIEEGL